VTGREADESQWGLEGRTKKSLGGADECPQCAFETSYVGGHCFKCGLYRPTGPRQSRAERAKDMVDWLKTNISHRVSLYLEADSNDDKADYRWGGAR